jgi:hypothetical protein
MVNNTSVHNLRLGLRGETLKHGVIIIIIIFFSCCFYLGHRASVKRFISLQFLNLRQLVGLLGGGISTSQGRCLTQTKNKHRHPCLEKERVSQEICCLIQRAHCDRHGGIYWREIVVLWINYEASLLDFKLPENDRPMNLKNQITPKEEYASSVLER